MDPINAIAVTPAENAHAGIAATEGEWAGAAPLFEKWSRRARESQYAHYEAAKSLDSSHYFLGIPVAVLTTVVGTSIYAALQKEMDWRIRMLVGSFSLLAAILAGLQTYLRYGERAEKHRSIGAAYGEIRRNLELGTTLPLRLRPPLSEFLSQTENKLNELARTSPNVSDRIFALGLRKMKESTARHEKGGGYEV